MKRMKTYEGGIEPANVEVYEEEIPGEGHMIAVGGPNIITVPSELGGGIANIVANVRLGRCPQCNALDVECLVTDREGPNGHALSAVCCRAEKLYIWVDLPEGVAR